MDIDRFVVIGFEDLQAPAESFRSGVPVELDFTDAPELS
jgi:hypothetical protein